MANLRQFWSDLRASFWLVPAMLVAAGILLALMLLAWDMLVEDQVLLWILGLSSAGVAGILAVFAGSLITVAGVLLGLKLIALAQTANQYSSDILYDFERERADQMVLGGFLGIAAYCLVVLGAILGIGGSIGIPVLAVWGSVLLTLAALGLLIYFMEHFARSLQVTTVLARILAQTQNAVARNFPDLWGEGDDNRPGPMLPEGLGQTILALKTGYIQQINQEALLHFARTHRTPARMERAVGEFVIQGTPLVSLLRGSHPDQPTTRALNKLYTIGPRRTIRQDPTFGVQQTVDISLKALETDDRSTAVMGIDTLTALFVDLVSRRIEPPHGFAHGVLWIIGKGPSFADLLRQVFGQLRQQAQGNAPIIRHMLEALATIASRTRSPQRRQGLLEQVRHVGEMAEETVPAYQDGADLRAYVRYLVAQLEHSRSTWQAEDLMR
ncbi:DUF2254 domain-containing protein [Anthocerotibacter panamensis]|uniref:DUF2254 domain-containing protein n=1 Tax=Anthocerotibacter panamensis TaxID=2857077 RepID=UPI001C4086F7|nr:DUF2254 domain-containing protein [Anthocerotibacter panamensis]